MSFAPIALFVYNRPWHTRMTVEAMLKNPEVAETPLHIFSDAPRSERERESVAGVREYIRSIENFKSIEIIERESNYGLARSIIDGVTNVCNQYGRVIVMEDDLVTSSHFLAYMNDALTLYEHDERVISVHGYLYPIKGPVPETFFIKGADCWGWATWKRGWDIFEPDGQVLLQELKRRKLTKSFDFNDSFPFTKMLKKQIEGRNDSWAIRWYASAFLKEKLTLNPGRNLVLNIGTDSTGTHCSTNTYMANQLSESHIAVKPIPVKENSMAKELIREFYIKDVPGLFGKIIQKTQNIFR
jgi:hypothetical protein